MIAGKNSAELCPGPSKSFLALLSNRIHLSPKKRQFGHPHLKPTKIWLNDLSWIPQTSTCTFSGQALDFKLSKQVLNNPEREVICKAILRKTYLETEQNGN